MNLFSPPKGTADFQSGGSYAHRDSDEPREKKCPGEGIWSIRQVLAKKSAGSRSEGWSSCSPRSSSRRRTAPTPRREGDRQTEKNEGRGPLTLRAKNSDEFVRYPNARPKFYHFVGLPNALCPCFSHSSSPALSTLFRSIYQPVIRRILLPLRTVHRNKRFGNINLTGAVTKNWFDPIQAHLNRLLNSTFKCTIVKTAKLVWLCPSRIAVTAITTLIQSERKLH